jgi:hypothetical protein
VISLFLKQTCTLITANFFFRKIRLPISGIFRYFDFNSNSSRVALRAYNSYI